MADEYSQAGQDKFVSSLVNNADPDSQHYFVDIGCWVPVILNNTKLLEEQGWKGLSLDISDLRSDWTTRNTPFIMADALTMDYEKLFNNHNLPSIIDYLNVDIEGTGMRFQALKKVFESNRRFAVITIEHDAYRGYEQSEMIPQREFLTAKGYVLVCAGVCLGGNPFEDWWVNSDLFEVEDYKHLISMNEEASSIIAKLK
jgi:hypothetical protein